MHFFIFFLVSILLGGCSSDKKVAIPGKRLSIIEDGIAVRQDSDTHEIEVSVDEATPTSSWPQTAFSSTHSLPHSHFQGFEKVVFEESLGKDFVSIIGHENKIFAFSYQGYIKGLDSKSGQEIFSYAHDLEDSTLNGGGIVYDSEFLYVAFSEGSIIKLRSSDGAVVWSHKIPYIIRSSPTVVGSHLYLITSSNHLVALSTKNGELLWMHSGLEESLTMVGGAPPTANEDVVLAPYSSGEIYALHPGNGYELWSEALVAHHGLDSKSMIGQMLAPPVLHRGTIFAVSHGDQFLALALRTGQKLWERSIGSITTPIVTEDFIFVLTTNNELACLTYGTGHVVWVHTLPSYEDVDKTKGRISWSGPLLADNKILVLGSNKQAIALSIKDGQVLETLEIGDKPKGNPIILNGILYTLTYSGSLLALGAPSLPLEKSS